MASEMSLRTTQIEAIYVELCSDSDANLLLTTQDASHPFMDMPRDCLLKWIYLYR